MIRRGIKPAVAVSIRAGFGGRSPAKAGSRCKEERGTT